jgi:1-acyl-sn-glycerol-3-phosphate acyltransferase
MKILAKAIFYGVHLSAGIIFQLFRITGRVKIISQAKGFYRQGKIILAANHPTLLEPVLVNLAFFPNYLRHPTLIPWNTPVRKFYDPSWCWWYRHRAVPVEIEGNQFSLSRKAIRKMKELLQNRQVLILFPEGGRTFKGKEFIISREKHKQIRQLKEGVAWLAKQTGAKIVPIWIEGSEKVLPNGKFPFPRFWKSKITIRIGQPLSLETNNSRNSATQKIALAILELADQ